MERNKQKDSIYFHSQATLKIVASAFILALCLIFNFIGSRIFIFPLANFLKFDITIFFITIIFIYIGWNYGLSTGFLMLWIGPLLSSHGYELIAILGHLILFFAQMTFGFVFLVFQKTKIKSNFFKVVCTSLITIGFLLIFNIFLSTPLYFRLYGDVSIGSFLDLARSWNNYKLLFLDIPNYYLATITIYFLFNLINLSINSFFLLLFLRYNARGLIFKNLKT
ncbi:MPN527 family putative ECF transporter permease subunit [Mycoplasmopsis columbinasalis]|nr:hypothetical protein [Mycoplasmopsis columbinasalis]